MLELVKAGGWPMIPLLLLGVLALAIVVERFWSLRRKEILPPGLGEEVRAWAARGQLEPAHIESLRRNQEAPHTPLPQTAPVPPVVADLAQ